ncbi:hypothetical protein HNP81_001080 [Peribacillus huizhouensis]|uniref:Uncharacterized protein n=1 Tax=Peribacillus huizhouensis TaxID=1501239 RepID=A0ABR6CN47_9BACI|nr:hypothetical protein [Peribacillus huizhouensis]
MDRGDETEDGHVLISRSSLDYFQTRGSVPANIYTSSFKTVYRVRGQTLILTQKGLILSFASSLMLFEYIIF